MNNTDIRVRAKVISHCLRQVGNNQTPAISILFLVTAAFDEQTKKLLGTEIQWDGWLTPAAFNRTMQTLSSALAWNGADLSELNETTSLLADTEVILVLRPEEYNGRERLRIAFVNSVGRYSLRALPTADAATLSETLAEKLTAFRATQAANAQTPASIASTTALPF